MNSRGHPIPALRLLPPLLARVGDLRGWENAEEIGEGAREGLGAIRCRVQGENRPAAFSEWGRLLPSAPPHLILRDSPRWPWLGSLLRRRYQGEVRL